jgi:PAS domain S-box-containing protein
VFGGAGKLVAMFGTIQDITDLRRAEQSLRDSEAALAEAQRLAHIGTWRWSIERDRLVYASEELALIHGVAPDELEALIKEQMEQVIHPEDRERVATAFKRFDEEGSNYEIEYRIVRADGEVRHVMEIGKAVFDGFGKPVEQVGTLQDITEKKAVEERFRRYFDLPLVGAAIYAPDKRWIEVNDKLCDLLGYGRDELTRLTWADLTHPDDLAENARLFDQAVAGEHDTYSMDKRFMRKDGVVLYSSISVQCLRKPDGAPDYFIVLIQDLTERKQAEEALKQLNEELEERVEERTAELRAAQDELVRKERLAALGQLTATVSHELRNPLGAMGASVAAIKKLAGDDNKLLGRSVAVLDRSIVRCDNIIGDLLDYSRVRPLEAESTGLDGWLETLLDEYAVTSGVELRRELESGVTVALDPDRFHRVMVNLLDNACQAMTGAEGLDGVKAVLTVATRRDGDLVEVSVGDTGPGIAAGDREKIFEPLISTKNFGVGLGLAIVKRVVEQHDGGIAVESAPDRGTRFVMTLPVKEPMESVA